MNMGSSGQDMVKKVRANRLLQRKRRKRIKNKFDELHQMNNVRHHKVFNTDFLDENRPEVLENQKRLAKELKRINWENKVKMLFSLALSLGIILFWLETCW